MATRPAQPKAPAPRKPAKKRAQGTQSTQVTQGIQGTPHVIVDFIFDAGALFIAVDNIGDAPALKVKTTFSAPLRGVMGTVNINDMALFRNIEFLAPHKAIRTFFDSSAAFFNRDEPRRIAVGIRYYDEARRRYQTTIHHDLGIYADIGYTPVRNK